METPRQLALDLAATLHARALYQGARRLRDPAVEPAAEPAAGTGAGAGMADAANGNDWESLRAEVLGCTRCALCETRTTVVFGEGDPAADLMFVGEAPGADEDRQGRPFVGRAGQLLTKMIEGMGLARGDVFIANVLKCRPPNNRDPAADEVEKCRPYLLRQIEHIQPKVICALGRHALRALTGYTGGITKVRGRPMEFHGRTVIPTFHPAYLLRNPSAKRDAWEDLKAVLRLLGLPVPEARRTPRR